MAATTSKAFTGQSHSSTSATWNSSSTPRSAASRLAFSTAGAEKSTDTTESPWLASHTPLRPSPSATARARCPGTSRCAWEARKTLGSVPKR